MPTNTFTLIEKITVGAAGASSITFTSIPQTYTDLKIVVSARSTRTAFAQDDLYYKYNGSSTSNSGIQIRGSGSAVISTSGWTTYNYGGQIDSNSATSNTFSNVEIYIPNYTSSNNKSSSVDGVEENNATEAYANLLANLWSNTAAITSIEFTIGAGNFVQNSTFYLYGIAKEGVSPSTSSAPYATGGDSIVFDGTYWIHTFTSSGTFTPKKSLTCDYLVVAGGGGGGANRAGGGGAGGFRTSIGGTALSLGTSAYTVTVGAGGAGGAPVRNRGASGSDSVFDTITSTGGGGGGTPNNLAGVAGGSGGGGCSGGTGGAGNTPSTSPSQGNNGGTNAGGQTGNPAAGGGGAGAVGGNGSNGAAGAGGAGTASSISGTSVTYAGGGGGGIEGGNTAGAGGSGGGGAGSSTGNGSNGTANLGGGGGGSASTDAYTGGNGGSGIVIVRYAA